MEKHAVLNDYISLQLTPQNQDDELRFGDEIEVGIVKIDKVAKTVKICVKSAALRDVRMRDFNLSLDISALCTGMIPSRND